MRPDLVIGPEERRERFQKDHESIQYNIVEIDDTSDASSPVNFELAENDDNEDYSVHESTLDPETGLMTGMFESPENGKERTSNHESSFEQDLLAAQSYGGTNCLHKKYRCSLVAETPSQE